MLHTLFIRESLETIGVAKPTHRFWKVPRMNSHRNAKTNVYQRQLLIHRVRQHGWTQRQAAEAAGVSIRTVAKWLARGRHELADRSSRPHRQPRRRDPTTEAAIVALRRTRATAREPGPSLTVDAFPRGCVMNNLFDIHS
jgi:predicted DNA-binding protein (UPF0251 family)